jgi:F-type H+-transporting ATPase subunit epsilon
MASAAIHFELVTLQGTKFGEDVYEVILPTPDGEIAILPNHIPLVTLAVPGVIAVRRRQTDSDNNLEYFATNGGAIEVIGNKVRVLVDEADRENEINAAEAQKAYERAQQLMRDAKGKVELDKAKSLMDLHAVRLKVASISRHKRH